MAIYLKLLGYPTLVVDDKTFVLPEDKRGALLTYLAFQGDWVGREQLAFLFWSDTSNSIARTNLRQLIKRTKQLAYTTNLQLDDQRICWNLNSDLAEFRQALAKHDWLEAFQYYDQPLLQGFLPQDCPEFGAWLELERDALKLSWREAALKVADNLARTERAAEATALLFQAWQLDNFDERLLQTYLKQAYAAGRKKTALSAFETFKERLLKTYEIDVSDETAELIRMIESDQLSLETKAPLAGMLPKRKRSLLIGRTRELGELKTLLSQSECQVLCISGQGGIGKTSLALELAEQLLPDFEHGTYFVSLASIQQPEQMVTVIASAFSFQFFGRADPKEQLVNYLRNKILLLLIDNFEHVLESASILIQLLEEAPGLKLLITSRQVPEIPDLWPFTLNGLSYEKADSDAEQLFIELARKQQPRFHLDEETRATIQKICQQVEGSPLAIELAVAWTRELSSQEIWGQLERSLELLTRDGQRQHDNMRAVFGNSWQLLSPEQQNLLAKLSIFRGGFTSDAAITVADATPYLLLSLQNRSLISKNETGRYHMHEIVRQFAEEKLNALVVEPDSYSRYASYFAEFLAKQSKQENLGHWDKVKENIASESANVRTAWDWSLRQRVWENISKALFGFSAYLIARGLNYEGKQIFGKLLEVLESNHDEKLLKARNQAHLGAFCRILGETDRAQTLIEASLPILEANHHVESLLFVYHTLGILWVNLGDYVQAEFWFQRSYNLSEIEGHKPTLANALASLGNICVDRGKSNEALSYYQRGLNIAEELGNQQTIAHLLFNKGNALWELGDKAAAEVQVQRASQLAKNIEHWPLYTATLANLAEMSFARGDYVNASKLRQESLSLARRLGDRRNEAMDIVMLGYDASRLSRADIARQHFLEGLRFAHAINLKGTVLDALIGLAELDLLALNAEASLPALVFATNHPSTLAEARERAVQLLQTAEKQVSAATSDSIRQQVQKLELDQLVSQVLNINS
ncbi:MAG: tetratricopeptide repeat protein [Trueperaceae bacterium]|nr:tetratricopeptide repeat protein [Trueperaceae bacterium]